MQSYAEAKTTEDVIGRVVYVTSKPILLIPSSDAIAHGRIVDNLTVRESFEPATGPTYRPGAAKYYVMIEANVRTLKDLDVHCNSAYALAADLNRVWTYVCGEPMNVAYLQLVAQEPPEWWTTNKDVVQEEIRAETTRLRGRVAFETRHYFGCNTLPLSDALDVLQAYRGSSDAVRTLVELHYLALTSERSEARLFFLAKGLEVALELIPGPTNDYEQKQRALPMEVQQDLDQSLRWLFTIANNRVEVRHAVQRGKGPTLHPQLSSQERQSFEHDADTVIRTVVCTQLGREPFLVSRPDGDNP